MNPETRSTGSEQHGRGQGERDRLADPSIGLWVMLVLCCLGKLEDWITKTADKNLVTAIMSSRAQYAIE